MAVGTLYEALKHAIDAIIEKRAGSGIPELVPIDSVGEDGSAVARVDGRQVQARLATEEPMQAGEMGWVAKTKDGGYIVHGGNH